MATNNNYDPQAGAGRPLPKKESELFKNIVKCYEIKQYKKGIKVCDSILKKYPDHGETLAMKGLTLNCMGKREEAHEFVRKGLMKDMRSHVCWHVFGLLHRSDRNYNEAIKAYKQALRIDSDNLQILRDLSLLQIQMRDLSGFLVTRHTILKLKPNNKIHWLAFALGKHLTDDREGAIEIIDIYLSTLDSENAPELKRGFESSELAMYRNMIMGEILNNEQKALDHLEECKDLVVDESSWSMSKAAYLLKLGEFDKAKEVYLSLFERGLLENYSVHTGYMRAVLKISDETTCEKLSKLKSTSTVATSIQLTSEQKQTLLDAYKEEVETLNIKSHACRRIALTLLEGDALRQAIDSYCRADLVKGVPCLGADLAALFTVLRGDGTFVRAKNHVDVKNHSIFKMVTEIVDGYIESLTIKTTFPNAAEEETEPPSTLLWTLYLRSYLHELCGEYTQGLSLIDRCIEHTPTIVDLYERKGRLLKLSGDLQAAAECLDTGRELDKQDRYINNKTTKYLLRANRENDALDTISLFTRHEGNPEQNLFDMQCTWYELELAACFARKKEWGKCLKKYMAVEKHFEDFHEDQFDFHSYCIRKVTLRSYVDVLRWEDNLWSLKTYRKAAEGIINCYLHLYDNPKELLTGDEEPDFSKMTAAERKKAKALIRKKKKKAEKKKEEEEKKRAETANGSGDKKKGSSRQQKVKDEDPDGVKLLKQSPLDECKKYVSTLVKNAPNHFSTWALQYKVAIRRGKYLMALQAIFKARAIESEVNKSLSGELFKMIIDFSVKLASILKNGEQNGENAGSPLDPLVKDIITSETSNLMAGKSICDFIVDYVESVKQDPQSSLMKRVAVVETLLLCIKDSLSATTCNLPSSMADSASIISIVTDGDLNIIKDSSCVNCMKVLDLLKGLGDDAKEAKLSFETKFKERYPLAKYI